MSQALDCNEPMERSQSDCEGLGSRGSLVEGKPVDHYAELGGMEHWNLSVAQLVEVALGRGEGVIASNGAFAVCTEPRTGCSPEDRFVVGGGPTSDHVSWESNRWLSLEHFEALLRDVREHCRARTMFVFDGYVGADPALRVPIRVRTEYAWHSLFARQLLIRGHGEKLDLQEPELEVICAPEFHATPGIHGTRSEAFVVVSLEHRLILIGGTRYAGEIKKSVFTYMNYLLPGRGVLPMHCAATVDQSGSTALLFGISGAGKTALSVDCGRQLLGDDEHGWSDAGVFNLEGGCYARCLDLEETTQPSIYRAIRFGAVLENVVLNTESEPDYHDGSISQNTRCVYPIEHIEGARIPGRAGHPKRIIFLINDGAGVLPAVARLTHTEVLAWYLNGYSSKVVRRDNGEQEAVATLSSCFAHCFLPLAPTAYARLLSDKIQQHNVACYLVNTGWTGGPCGRGKRISLVETRALVEAILSGSLDETLFQWEPYFGLHVPTSIPGVPAELLQPRSAWLDTGAYSRAAQELAELLKENLGKYKRADL